jgi:predicted DCC family thiol-disulfide oxidoreductase YuxK
MLATRPELIQPGLLTVVWVEMDSRGQTEIYTESDAALRVLTSLGGAWRLLGVFFWVPCRIRTGLYRYIAKNRTRWFGTRNTCRAPMPEERARFLE